MIDKSSKIATFRRINDSVFVDSKQVRTADSSSLVRFFSLISHKWTDLEVINISLSMIRTSFQH